MKAHRLAGQPRGAWAPLGSYEAWDRLIRGAVHYATGLDPCSTRRKAADEAPDRLRKLALIEGWETLPGGTSGGVTAAEAVRQATDYPLRFPVLHNALMQYGRDGKLATAGSIGNRIRGMRNEIIGGMKFEKVDEKARAALWKISKTGQDCPDSQDCDESSESSESVSLPSRASFDLVHDVMIYGDTPKSYGNGREIDSLDSSDSLAAGQEQLSKAQGLLEALSMTGITVELDGDQLSVDDPHGSLSDDDREELVANKTGLIALLSPCVE